VLAGCEPPPPTIVTFNYNGTNGSDGSVQHWTAPSNVRSITVNVYGAAGGGSTGRGGRGGHAHTDIAVWPGETLSIFVGGSAPLTGFAGVGSFNGGGAGFVGGNGGGASDIRRGAAKLADRLVVAGGGGGGSSGWDQQEVQHGFAGGDGGDLFGKDGQTLGPPGSPRPIPGAGGGSQSAGGAGGSGSGNGSKAQGGAAGGTYGGGGGGGGYYGGGAGGGCNYTPFACGGSGGGGSGFIVSSAKNAIYRASDHTGHGVVTIKY
jgi:hypothetical protein